MANARGTKKKNRGEQIQTGAVASEICSASLGEEEKKKDI